MLRNKQVLRHSEIIVKKHNELSDVIFKNDAIKNEIDQIQESDLVKE